MVLSLVSEGGKKIRISNFFLWCADVCASVRQSTTLSFLLRGVALFNKRRRGSDGVTVGGACPTVSSEIAAQRLCRLSDNARRGTDKPNPP